MNLEVVWTVLGVGLVVLFLLPFYIAMAVAFEKSKMKIQLEFLATANTIEKKVKFDEAVERLFEEGVQE
ncbi:MAG: hypothetical protein EBW14_01860 [Oxalobacteraceae bacterium]|jgi:Na+-transporting methylmalonyl-CoA/oxaloacetate decarboxylase gamma subunit|nr:hypothetical protein [Oxalobacteraceae bacterium]